MVTSRFAQPTDPVHRVLRLNFMDYNTSKEVLWADTRKEGHYGLQYKSTPYRVGPSSGNGVGVTLTMVITAGIDKSIRWEPTVSVVIG